MASSGPVLHPTPSALRRTEVLPEPTLDSLLAVLFQATSPNPAALAQATEYLNDLESRPSLWLRLLDIAFEQSVPLDGSTLVRERATFNGLTSSGAVQQEDVAKRWSAIRTVAIIRFKNGVDKYWRSRVVNRVTITIPQETKEQLRKTLLRCLNESDRGVALQASVAIARIARHDFPNAWPSLFNDLQQAMIDAHARITGGQDVETSRLILLRASDVCARTLKELSTVRILAGKIRMTELSQQLLPTLVPMFQQYFAETMPAPGAQQASDMQRWAQSSFLAARIRTSHLLLKSVSHLAVADSGTLSRNAQAEGGERPNFARDLFLATPAMLQFIRDTRWAYLRALSSKPSSSDEPILVALQKHLLAFGKLYAGLVDRDRSKAVTWQGWDEVVMWYWQQAVEATSEELAGSSKMGGGGGGNDGTLLTQPHPTRLIVQSLTLLQHSLQEWRVTDTLPAIFKDEQTIQSIVNVLVGKLMLLTSDDLELWAADPEDWSVAEEAETYNVDVRPAAERALMTLAITAPSRQSRSVSDLLWQKFVQTFNQVDDSLTAVLQLDAIYAALGRCREQLPHSDETVSKAIVERLVPEASLNHPAGPSWVLIRRRIAWLIWEWSEHILPAHRPAVYELLVSLLQDVPGKTDAAVRLAAARSLSALADALEFDSDAFQPYIDASLSRLATLAAGSELHEMDSIKACTNTMSILIERLGARIAPHLEQLATLVPHLWTLDDPECKARPSVIVFVGRLVRSVELIPHGSQGAGTSLHGIVEVIVRESLSPQNSPLLGKDALELWIRTLRSSSQMTDPLFRLLDLLPSLLDQPDFCPEACRVAQESTLMSAQAVIAKYGAALFEGFAKIVGDPQSPLILHPISALDIMIQALHAQGVDTMSWATLLDQSGLFFVLLGSLLKVKDSSVVTGYFVALLARTAFIMNGTPIFLDLVRSAAFRLEGTQCDADLTVLKPMAEAWCSRVETMASSRKRKITCLGLAALLSNADPQREPHMFALLPSLVGVWMDLLGDIRQDAGSAEDIGAPPLPNAPPSSPTLNRTFSHAPDLLRRSPSPALSIPGLEGIDDADDWLQETSPGKARLTELGRLDPVNTVKLTTCISDCLRRAQAHGGPVFEASLASMDNLVLEIFWKDLNQ